ncbi:MAG TPA: hypothetical protein DCF68_00800 [Cyanothece sp. UBA12306]|nr:hypothetical protein [Cyanothece sp. UBA12306]
MTQALAAINYPNYSSPLILQGVSWEMYEQLLETFAEYPNLRLTYYQETLELMTPLPEHETYSWNLGRLITVLSEELGLEIRGLKSTTWRSQAKGVGKEADQCFYIQHEYLVRNKLKIDLQNDPPPDLVIEIDLTNSSLSKFPIYAALKVPEIWIFQNKQLVLYHLSDNEYQEAEFSLAFPSFPVKKMTQFILLDPQKGENARLKELRKWITTQKLNRDQH